MRARPRKHSKRHAHTFTSGVHQRSVACIHSGGHCIRLTSLSLQLSCANYLFLSYKLNAESNSCHLTNQPNSNKEPATESRVPTLQWRLKRKLQDVEIQSK